MEDYDPATYDAFEAAIANEIAQDEATIGEIDTNLRLNPCEDCPLMNFPVDEAVRVGRGIGSTNGEQGLDVTIQYETADGRKSEEIVLGRHNKNSIGDRRQQEIYASAAQRTQECVGPQRVPRFLGPLATKKCPALQKYQW